MNHLSNKSNVVNLYHSDPRKLVSKVNAPSVYQRKADALQRMLLVFVCISICLLVFAVMFRGYDWYVLGGECIIFLLYRLRCKHMEEFLARTHGCPPR